MQAVVGGKVYRGLSAMGNIVQKLRSAVWGSQETRVLMVGKCGAIYPVYYLTSIVQNGL